MESLTPRKIVEQLDKYVIGQDNAKDLYLATGHPPTLPPLDEETREKLRSLGYID